MTGRIAAVFLFLAAGCAPQNATLSEGEYKAFLAERSSGSLITGNVDFAQGDGESGRIDCPCTITYVESDDDSILDGTVCDNDSVYYTGYCWACAEFLDADGDGEPDGDEDAYGDWDECFTDASLNFDFDIDGNGRLSNSEQGQWVLNPWVDGDAAAVSAPKLGFETWPHVDTFQTYKEAIEPWRGEAIMTSEGDFQVTFHHYLPGGSDFRFGFVIDPNFQPRKCVADGDGVTEEDIDGDWIEAWTDSSNYVDGYGPEGDGDFYLLNAGSFQFDPTETDAWGSGANYWYLPEDWQAGFAFGKYGDEQAFLRRSQYAKPLYYLLGEESDLGAPSPLYPNYWANLDEDEVEEDNSDWSNMLNRVTLIADDMVTEFETLDVDIRPIIHTNVWRTPDGDNAGLDGWVGMHFNYVQLDAGSTLEEGGSASGEFQIILESSDSASVVFVKGRFETDNIRDDFWVTNNVLDEKFEADGTERCGW